MRITLFVLLLIPAVLNGQDQRNIRLANEYYANDEKDKALILYKDLAKSSENIPLIHGNYLNALLDADQYDEAIKYLRKIQKEDPGNVLYNLDMGYVYFVNGDIAKSDKEFKDIISKWKSNILQIKVIADYFSTHRLTEYAVESLKEGQKALGSNYAFSLELAMLYRIQQKTQEMIQEYLNYVTQNASNIQYVKNILQGLLTKPDELQGLETVLYQKVQQDPDREVYTDLLIWVTMQQKNFYSSFMQAKAYDKRYKRQGEKSMEVARVAYDNNDFEIAGNIYQYVVDEFSDGVYYLQARLGLINSLEAEVKRHYPVNKDSVNNLIGLYQKFIVDYPNRQQALEARRNEALLYANYLDELDTAITLLNELSANPQAPIQLKALVKLDLGDIYVLKGEPWESALLYAQVEKSQKESTIGYDAKLKNAKLSYFKGDFQLAQEHLDILKEATTRDIANDAMELSMRIKENLGFDSLGLALRQYSYVELLQYQHKIDRALDGLKLLEEGKIKISTQEAKDSNLRIIDEEGDSSWVSYSNRSILDDTYWLEAKIRMELGEFDQSLILLQKIQKEYPDDVLADDAMFTEADIYERQLKDIDKAMAIYREFLNKFPGSVYVAEVRKRFRTLRGDFSGENSPPPPLN